MRSRRLRARRGQKETSGGFTAQSGLGDRPEESLGEAARGWAGACGLWDYTLTGHCGRGNAATYVRKDVECLAVLSQPGYAPRSRSSNNPYCLLKTHTTLRLSNAGAGSRRESR